MPDSTQPTRKETAEEARVRARASAAARPSSFLNPLGPIEAIARSEERTVEEALEALRSGTVFLSETAGKGVATATKPAADAATAVGRGLSDTAGFLSMAVNKADAIAKKVLIGEVVLLVTASAIVGAALWFTRKTSVPVITKVLLSKGKG